MSWIFIACATRSFVPTPSVGGDQDRRLDPLERAAEQPAERADVGQDARREGAARDPPHLAQRLVLRVDIDAGIAIARHGRGVYQSERASRSQRQQETGVADATADSDCRPPTTMARMAQALLITTLLTIAGLIATMVMGFRATPAHVADHIIMALVTVVIGLFSQSMTMFFFIGTGRS